MLLRFHNNVLVVSGINNIIFVQYMIANRNFGEMFMVICPGYSSRAAPPRGDTGS